MLELGFLRNFMKFMKNPVTFRGGVRLLIQERQLWDVPLGGFWKEALGKK